MCSVFFSVTFFVRVWRVFSVTLTCVHVWCVFLCDVHVCSCVVCVLWCVLFNDFLVCVCVLMCGAFFLLLSGDHKTR